MVLRQRGPLEASAPVLACPSSETPHAAAGALMGYRVGVAGVAQRQEVAALRRAAYRQAAQFDWIDESTLDWSAADEAGTVLAVCDPAGILVSTLRATVFPNALAAENFLEYSLTGIDVPCPTLVLSRAATAPRAAQQGLFALLRYAYLLALPATPVRSVIAVVFEGAPHTNAMHGCGYGFYVPQAAWDSEAVAHARPLLAVLPQAKFGHSLSKRHAALGGRLDGVQIDVAGISAALCTGCSSR